MTTSITVTGLIEDLAGLAYNPAAAQAVAVSAVEKIYDGNIALLDANNPFVTALEVSAVNTALFLQQAHALTQKQYPAAALSNADLYLHLSDTDYVGMFALPSRAKFQIWIEKQQILDNLVADPATGISKMTIPRNTVFYAVGTPFSLSYPIDIRRLQHGALQIVYDASKTSPLETLDTNVIEYTEATTTEGVTYVCFSVDTMQFSINSTTASVSASSGVSTNIKVSSQFYYCRVWRWVGGVWEEIAVTYTQQVYDSLTPTAVVKLVDDTLSVAIPPIYTISGLISGKIRIDVYETDGPINKSYGNLQTPDFSANWLAIDDAEQSLATVAAVSKLTNLLVFSTDTTTGGRNALSFEEMRARVIKHAVGPRQIPITPAQASVMLTDDGYNVVVGVDSVTDRRFVASRSLPLPKEIFPKIENDVYTAANAHILTSLIRTSDAASLYGCVANSVGMTLTSSALFREVNGVPAPITTVAYNLLMAESADSFVETINDGSYFYTPFHYVLDTSGETFAARAYAMDWPSIDKRTFVQENATTGLQVSIGATFVIEKTSTGYKLTLNTSSNDAYKALPDSSARCQLRIKCSDGSYAYVLGAQNTRLNSTDERVFVFNLPTTFAIDSDHTLDITTLFRENGTSGRMASLTEVASVLFSTDIAMPPAFTTSAIDSLLGDFQLPAGSVGITHEQLTLHLGDHLDTLWLDYRSYADSVEYEVWATDVVATYAQDVYEEDPITGAFFTTDGTTLTYNKLHSAGDTKLDTQGNPIYEHRAGDIKIDDSGNPIPVANYQTRMIRSVDFYAIDAAYRFANDAITTQYVKAAYTKLLTQLTEDLTTLNDSVLEKTKIFYHPIVTDGQVEVYLEKDSVIVIDSAQSLKVAVYVPSETASNASLLSSLRSTATRLIGEYLAANSTVSTDALESSLRTAFGSDAVSVRITGLGGSDYRVLTLKNPAARLSVAKNLVVKVNNLIGMEEAIDVTFVTHDTQ